jgi:two-component system NtrC family sensor kinase
VKIGTKLVIFLTVPLVLLVVLSGYLGLRGSRARLHQEIQREGRGIALTARMALEDYLRDRQIDDIREMVEKISGYERILGIRIFNPSGDLICQSSSLNSLPFSQRKDLLQALKEKRAVETHRSLGDHPVVSFVFPLLGEDGSLLGAAQFLQVESYIDEDARVSRRSIATLTGAMILAVGLVVLLVTRFSVGRPIEDLIRRFREVGSRQAVSRVPVRRNDELGRLAREFNIMCERLESVQTSLQAEQTERRRVEARLRNAERLASIGRLSAGLAHEIGTPLNVIGGRAETLRRKLTGNELADKNLGIITSQIDRIARIVRGMLDFAAAREPHLNRMEVIPVFQRVLDLLGQRLEEAEIRSEVVVPSDLPAIQADPDQMYEVFLNLATNALDAMPRGGVLRVRGEVVQAVPPRQGGSPAEFLAVAVEDTGEGIAPENLDRIFDPFFTTKDVGRGTGLGLSVSYGIVQEHGGWIDVASEPGRGSRLTVYLPLNGVPEQESLSAAGGEA